MKQNFRISCFRISSFIYCETNIVMI